jgi:hypothetical protein
VHVAVVSREELINLVQRLLNPQPGDTDEDQQSWMNQIKESVPDPNVSGYIFWDYRGETAEQIVDKALAYRPISL